MSTSEVAVRALVVGFVITFLVITGFAYMTLFERKLLARFQHRVGPNRAGYIPIPRRGGKERRVLSGIMQPAADGMADALRDMALKPPKLPVWSNVTAQPHVSVDQELLKQRLVEQIVSPVQWSQTCKNLVEGAPGDTMEYHEIAPGSVLRGLMRRIDRTVKVTSHDQP